MIDTSSMHVRIHRASRLGWSPLAVTAERGQHSVMLRSRLFSFSVLVITLSTASCSSSDDGGAATATDAGDAGSTDTKPEASAETSTDTGASADAPVDETSEDATDEGGTPDVPTSKCAGVTCPGSYSKCCPSTGKCYDTRSEVCY
jgi:hypothetical protein